MASALRYGSRDKARTSDERQSGTSTFRITGKGLILQIQQRYIENQRITLQIDNAQMAAEDFKSK